MAKRPAGAGGSSRRRQLAYGAVMLASSAMNNLFVTMLDSVGVKVEKLGDSSGKLQGLF
jgi:hypothetical protein